MKRLYKRLTAAGLVVVLGMTGMAVMNTAGCGSSGESVSSTETGETAADEAYRSAPADLTLWYADDSYADFFTEAAVRYYAKTGKKVAVQYQDTIDYLGTIYDKTMQDDGYPDVYLISGDSLAEAYLYGLVAVIKRKVLMRMQQTMQSRRHLIRAACLAIRLVITPVFLSIRTVILTQHHLPCRRS